MESKPNEKPDSQDTPFGDLNDNNGETPTPGGFGHYHHRGRGFWRGHRGHHIETGRGRGEHMRGHWRGRGFHHHGPHGHWPQFGFWPYPHHGNWHPHHQGNTQDGKQDTPENKDGNKHHFKEHPCHMGFPFGPGIPWCRNRSHSGEHNIGNEEEPQDDENKQNGQCKRKGSQERKRHHHFGPHKFFGMFGFHGPRGRGFPGGFGHRVHHGHFGHHGQRRHQGHQGHHGHHHEENEDFCNCPDCVAYQEMIWNSAKNEPEQSKPAPEASGKQNEKK